VQLILVDPMRVSGVLHHAIVFLHKNSTEVYMHHAMDGTVELRAYSGTAGDVTMAQLEPRGAGGKWQWTASTVRARLEEGS